MKTCSIEFIFLLFGASMLFFWLPSVRWRQAFFTILSLGFLATHDNDLNGWIALAVFLGTGYLFVRALEKHPSRLLLGIYLTTLIVAFLTVKQYAFVTALLPGAILEHPVRSIGLSYMLFRQIHLAVDAAQGQITGLTVGQYLNYQLNPFGLVAGPIQRFQEFQESWATLEPVCGDRHDVLAAYLRVFLGILKVAAIGALCLWWYDKAVYPLAEGVRQPRVISLLKFALAFYMFPLYIYFNFAGYCDIMIGGARLLGMRMPENFDSPFLSRNMIEYWTRWHRTLGFWIRDYVFTPLYKAMIERWPSQPLWLIIFCYSFPAFIIGIWHGSTWNFVYYGLINAVGVCGAKLWEMLILRRRGRPGLRAYLQSTPIRWTAIFVNFHFVCLTLLLFPDDLDRTVRILTTVWNNVR